MPKLDHFRAFPRQSVSLEATVSAAEGVTWQVGARVLNLSLAGACLELKQGVEERERLHVAISIPTLWDPLHLGAVAVWTRSDSLLAAPRVGVHFDTIDAPTLRILLQLLETTAARV